MHGTGNHIRTLPRRVAWLGVAASVMIAGYAAWRYFDPFAAVRQGRAKAELQQDWQNGRSAILPGHPFALLRIPRLWGDSGSFAVLEGTTGYDLSVGPSHFAGTALPGQIGNFAIAGHTVGGGNPFLHLANVEVGDKIIVDTSDEEDIYAVTVAPRVISAENVGILEPVPDMPDGSPAVARITIISCVWPEHADDSRTVVEGVLAESEPRMESSH